MPHIITEHVTQGWADNANLFNQIVSLGPPVLATIDGHAILIQLEGQPKGLCLHATNLETTFAKLLGNIVKGLDVLADTGSILLGDDRNIQRLAINDVLRVVVREFGSGPE